jgi:hypothetical protein
LRAGRQRTLDQRHLPGRSIVLVRLRYHQATKDYVERRTREGKSKREIIRCLKRYVAREVYVSRTGFGGDRSPRQVRP